jgi:hypothetical protein
MLIALSCSSHADCSHSNNIAAATTRTEEERNVSKEREATWVTDQRKQTLIIWMFDILLLSFRWLLDGWVGGVWGWSMWKERFSKNVLR